jgi:hypothetical protein
VSEELIRDYEARFANLVVISNQQVADDSRASWTTRGCLRTCSTPM